MLKLTHAVKYLHPHIRIYELLTLDCPIVELLVSTLWYFYFLMKISEIQIPLPNYHGFLVKICSVSLCWNLIHPLPSYMFVSKKNIYVSYIYIYIYCIFWVKYSIFAINITKKLLSKVILLCSPF